MLKLGGFLNLALLLAPCLALAQQQVGPQPGHGYGNGVDPNGTPFMHGVVDPGAMDYTAVAVGTTSTLVLPAPASSARTKLYLLNPSGRISGTTAVDIWCSYGVPAGMGQGFILRGYGDRVTEDMAATIDQRALYCIAPQAVTINVGAVQQ